MIILQVIKNTQLKISNKGKNGKISMIRSTFSIMINKMRKIDDDKIRKMVK